MHELKLNKKYNRKTELYLVQFAKEFDFNTRYRYTKAHEPII